MHGGNDLMKIILTIAGSDTGAGAGIQQDLKTITALGHYAVTVPTALTAQNTVGIRKVMPVPEDMLKAQLDAILDDFDVSAVKIGMIPDIQSARIVVDAIRRLDVPVVFDPVMLSTSGTRLMSDECVDDVKKELFPLCTIVTPNIPEAIFLAGSDADCDLDATGRLLTSRFNTAFLLKGGHAEGTTMRDVLYCADGQRHEYCSPRIQTSNLHGTGCTLSSAVATLLAESKPLHEAVEGAKRLIDCAIEKGSHLSIGKGNGPLWFY